MKTHKTFDGHRHSEETKALIGAKNAIKQAGEKNSQYGSKWMKRGDETKKVPGDKIHEHLADGWDFGRVYTFRTI